ncbi:hypothetical protein Cp4435_02603 [Clostridium perfringens]|uniref:hypothetical protein n=1 Tax=Clostridium perfringens TaxID=1502 RepID=UPI002443B0E0|nr:hypothetical protein [Clostridium perfringens]MDG6885391.1 hypothetical protein [Clostridium perfringens]
MLKERDLIVKKIKQGDITSDKKSKLDKIINEPESYIKEYLLNRSIKQIDLMKKYNISINILKKYIKLVKGSVNYI